MSWRHINKEKLRKLNPCEGRWKNYLKHYSDFEGDIVEFLELEHITPEDKVWVFIRVAPRLLLEIFALDCAFSAVRYSAAYAASAVARYARYARYAADAASAVADAAYADAVYAADAAADYAAVAAYAAATKKQERENQVDAMIMICEGVE